MQHNLVHLFGFVETEPKVVKDNETGAIKNVVLYLRTVTSSRKYMNANEDNAIVQDQVMVWCKDPAITKDMATLKPFDTLYLKGTINTKNVIKQTKCVNPDCIDENGRIHSYPVNQPEDRDDAKPSMITYVTPIFIDIRETNMTEEDALASLIKRREISNEVQVIGNLTTTPKKHEHGMATSYQIGVTRKFFVKGDSQETTSDYPYIRSYGEQGEADYAALEKDSGVLIDGFLKTRRFERTCECPYCHTEKKWENSVLEIIPYSVQYLSNYKKFVPELSLFEEPGD